MSPPPESPLEVDDLLAEILLRLPPWPSSLPRAVLVCARWRRIITDPQFPHRFRAHHRTPPLIGFFVEKDLTTYSFDSTLDPPDHIPAARFRMPRRRDALGGFHGGRHGLVILLTSARDAVTIRDPLTNRQRRVAFPEWFPKKRRLRCRNAAVLCDDAGEAGHVHGDCYSSPFKIVLLRDDLGRRACAYIFESKYGTWRSMVPTIAIPKGIRAFRPSILVQNALYWELDDGSIIGLDLQSHCCLDVIEKPRDDVRRPEYHFQILRTIENRLGFAIVSRESMRMELWERRTNYHGVVEWVLEKTVELEKILPQGASSPVVLDFIEDTNMIFMSTNAGARLFTIQLESMECRYVGKRDHIRYYPYANFYTRIEQVEK